MPIEPLETPLLEARNLTIAIKKDGKHLNVLRGVNFEIGRGEIVGLAGESGCGKTISALSVMGLLPKNIRVSDGEIVLNEESRRIVLNGQSEKEMRKIRGKEISMIFQEARQSLNPLVKVGLQITETLELHGVTDKKERRLAALAELEKLGFSDCERVYNSYPHELSGGMCQRVMIAIASICRPKLLIADEPTTSLDKKNHDQIISLLGEIKRNFGTAVFFISHDLSVMRSFCQRILVMYAGRIVEEGASEKIFTQPFHPYTKGLLGAIPSGHLRGRPLANIPGRIPSITSQIEHCPFAPRCPHFFPACLTGFPPAEDLGDGHKASCFLAKAARSG
ncbi:MAG: ABC transporter ATP-binding protein [Spirochaetes bacterium]|nr:ABC transporter ATP-binding protein [Spirochaetota bacterium]